MEPVALYIGILVMFAYSGVRDLIDAARGNG
jgi:hypothetical protein